MLALTVYSQDSTKVAISTLENFKRFTDKCDSLKVSYFEINREFDSLIVSNNTMFKDFEQTRAEKIQLQKDLQQKEKDMKKFFQRPTKSWLVPLVVGGVCGLIVAGAI